MFFGPHPKPSQWLNCGPVFRRILWMCLFLQLLNGKMFNFWTSEVGRPGRFSRISRGQVLQAPEEWWFSTTMTCYSWYFINGGQWFHIRNSFMAMDTEWWSRDDPNYWQFCDSQRSVARLQVPMRFWTRQCRLELCSGWQAWLLDGFGSKCWTSKLDGSCYVIFV